MHIILERKTMFKILIWNTLAIIGLVFIIAVVKACVFNINLCKISYPALDINYSNHINQNEETMAINKNYTIKKARNLGRKLKRSGIAEEVISEIEAFDGSYKGAMELCGKLIFWADASTYDEYWQEQVQKGLHKEVDKACIMLSDLETMEYQ